MFVNMLPTIKIGRFLAFLYGNRLLNVEGKDLNLGLICPYHRAISFQLCRFVFPLVLVLDYPRLYPILVFFPLVYIPSFCFLGLQLLVL